MPRNKGAKTIQIFWRFLQRKQRYEFLLNERKVESAPLALQNSLNIGPILSPCRKDLVNDQILCATGAQDHSWNCLPISGSSDGIHLERKTPKSNIQTHAARMT